MFGSASSTRKSRKENGGISYKSSRVIWRKKLGSETGWQSTGRA
ncbi:hypothetical protein OESDEN_24590 [Oesophagostomum dentatum]|uniref:Uncharacterized protein n=1 Tax=Oesophagostomum dentatum TaxID=61180 RepID=A0A0B1RSZ0_OESDE|nr:hypothetical protein OESDEN_24590 [Oesophagostomum dentatum]